MIFRIAGLIGLQIVHYLGWLGDLREDQSAPPAGDHSADRLKLKIGRPQAQNLPYFILLFRAAVISRLKSIRALIQRPGTIFASDVATYLRQPLFD